jgi:LEA14-like dessication related protein
MIALLLVGCAGTEFSQFLPTVKFKRFDVNTIDFTEIGVDFVFDVENPNPVDIPLERFDYALAFEEIDVLTGNNPDGLQLTAEGSSELALPVTIDFEGIYEVAQAARGEDDIGYGLRGGFGFDTDVGPVDIAYAEEGDFPALRTPKITLGQLRFDGAGGDRADFSLDFDIDNDHGSNLLFQNLDFEMKFAGTKVGAGVVEELGEVPGASSQTFSIPFSVDYLDAIDAIAAAASGEKLRVDMVADMDVDTPFGLVPLTVDEEGDVSVRDGE